MKQWDIWTCDFADAGPHPAIVVSHPDRVASQNIHASLLQVEPIRLGTSVSLQPAALLFQHRADWAARP